MNCLFIRPSVIGLTFFSLGSVKMKMDGILSLMVFIISVNGMLNEHSIFYKKIFKKVLTNVVFGCIIVSTKGQEPKSRRYTPCSMKSSSAAPPPPSGSPPASAGRLSPIWSRRQAGSAREPKLAGRPPSSRWFPTSKGLMRKNKNSSSPSKRA